jgi:hypothetical protein
MFHHAAEVFFLSSVGLFMTSIGFAVAWVRARERATRAESFMEGLRSAPPVQLRDSSPAIDAIAMEVERIGEGQRFLTRVLSEQQSGRVQQPQRPVGSITPH